MNELQRLVEAIGETSGCEVIPPRGLPLLRPHDRLPNDLLEFYRLCGGVRLFERSTFPIRIVEPEGLVRANPEIVGTEHPDDITDSWYIVARGGSEAVSIDCDVRRLGRCYDSFWDRHAVAGSCPIVALSFTELLRRLFESEGRYLYWAADGAPKYGDAYEDRPRVIRLTQTRFEVRWVIQDDQWERANSRRQEHSPGSLYDTSQSALYQLLYGRLDLAAAKELYGSGGISVSLLDFAVFAARALKEGCAGKFSFDQLDDDRHVRFDFSKPLVRVSADDSETVLEAPRDEVIAALNAFVVSAVGKIDRHAPELLDWHSLELLMPYRTN